MDNSDRNRKIKICKAGPYRVTGDVPLLEKIIVPKGNGYVYEEGRQLPQSGQYLLCRCGRSKNAPFCDGAHIKTGFIGEETASREKFEDRADLLKGPGIDLMDDHRCALARFCHREKGTVWDLLKHSDQEDLRQEVIQGATECPAGRLVPRDRQGNVLEPQYKPAVTVLQDPENGVSGGIFVQGGIPVESADGSLYETCNRVVLCRCGRSINKPFCDAMHIAVKFTDKKPRNI
ncbi:MAG TPA: iron-binding protein [Clostridiales bacterium]|nr:iron-binding protein [Clostridiales bacterium]